MINQNNAAQAAEQDDITQRVLTDPEILAIGAMHGRRSVSLLPMFRAFEGAVLAKLRAQVANVPLTHRCANCGAAFQGAGCPSCRLAAPLASAPVAGDAQPAAYLTLDEEGSPCMLFFDVVEARSYCALGEEPEPLFLHAAPQPSAEDVRNAALEALEAAQRFIRNGIEFGYIRMPEADTPDPAHRTPRLIDAAIRALKQQGVRRPLGG
ncbi:hypothetical protein ABFG95_12075 [Achromobacter sp. HNDS-1]|uniref:Uncharacterized protein n=1 Tax=Achromobacter sp. HNDS-1 TaxID=3151598 RepID=A0AAU7LIF5_9BURK